MTKNPRPSRNVFSPGENVIMSPIAVFPRGTLEHILVSHVRYNNTYSIVLQRWRNVDGFWEALPDITTLKAEELASLAEPARIMTALQGRWRQRNPGSTSTHQRHLKKKKPS